LDLRKKKEKPVLLLTMWSRFSFRLFNLLQETNVFDTIHPPTCAALDYLRVTGYPVQGSGLEHLSLVTSAHINLHGSYHFDLQALKKCQDQLRPLRISPPPF
jgi:hypothetical protein